MLKIKLSDNKNQVELINNRLKENKEKYGKAYCPCSLKKTDDTVCMCKEFRDMDTVGECHCGKFIKIEEQLS